MAKPPKDNRPEARLPKGFRDIPAAELRAQSAMLTTLREVFERYGYDPLETPAIEYTDALGKFLPDQDRPNAGVFSFQDEDRQWLSLRYDLTAPLARFVAEQGDRLAKPYRRYAMGPVWRNEKPGPGRYRQFLQCDADTVGTESVAADAEACMLMADAVEALGIPRGQYRIRVNNRKVLDGIREASGLLGAEFDSQWLTAVRGMDKFDKFGVEGVRLLLGKGRRDESGDFTKGAELDEKSINLIIRALTAGASGAKGEFETGEYMIAGGPARFTSPHRGMDLLGELRSDYPNSRLLAAGIDELSAIQNLAAATGYGADRIVIDPSVVRGLDYYTGPVFEAELTFEVRNEDGQTVRFGSVGGGGRYDDLVARFTGQRVPATGFSIGVSRLQAALAQLDSAREPAASGPVVVLVMDKAQLPRYQRMAQALRTAGIRAEMYLGTAGMKAQMKYADRRGSPCVVIQGGDEIARGEVQIKDLIEGAKAAAAIKDNREWKSARPAQVSVAEARLVEAVREILARHKS
jgi:histidyl-tRNA synthetase